MAPKTYIFSSNFLKIVTKYHLFHCLMSDVEKMLFCIYGILNGIHQNWNCYIWPLPKWSPNICTICCFRPLNYVFYVQKFQYFSLIKRTKRRETTIELHKCSNKNYIQSAKEMREWGNRKKEEKKLQNNEQQ